MAASHSLEMGALSRDAPKKDMNLVVSEQEVDRNYSSSCSAAHPTNEPSSAITVVAPGASSVGSADPESSLHAGDGPHQLKTIGWKAAACVMIAETISLGILSLPRAVADLGLVPGSILIPLLGAVTTYTGYIVWAFCHHYKTTSFVEVGEKIGGKTGKWVVEVGQALFLVFLMAGHVLIFSEAALRWGNGGCRVMFTTVFMIIGICCTYWRTLKGQAVFSMFSCMSILVATFITVIAIAVDKSADTAVTYAFTPLYTVTTPARVCLAVANIILAFTGHIAYPTIIHEMERPQDFPKALFVVNGITTFLYTLVGVLIYHFAGQDVLAPALSSGGRLTSQISYGTATPTIIVAGVIPALVLGKRMMLGIWGIQEGDNPTGLETDTWSARVVHGLRPACKLERFAAENVEYLHRNHVSARWCFVASMMWFIAFIIANSIPGFNLLLGVIGAGIGVWICLGLPALMYFYMVRDQDTAFTREAAGHWHISVATLNVSIFLVCVAAMAFGLYGSIHEIAHSEVKARPFSCS